MRRGDRAESIVPPAEGISAGEARATVPGCDRTAAANAPLTAAFLALAYPTDDDRIAVLRPWPKTWNIWLSLSCGAGVAMACFSYLPATRCDEHGYWWWPFGYAIFQGGLRRKPDFLF